MDCDNRPYLSLELYFSLQEASYENHLKFAEILTKLLDNQFKIGRFRFRLDPLIGAIPGIGDFIAFLICLYIVRIGIQMRLPANKIAQMLGNVMLDFVIGLIPFVGDAIDFVFKANSRNMEIIRQHHSADFVEGVIV